MTDQERDELLLELSDKLTAADKRFDRLRERMDQHHDALFSRLDLLEKKLDAVSDHVQDVARAIREMGGNVPDDPQNLRLHSE